MTRQTFDTIDVLRLEVGSRATSGGISNLLKNPTGERGAWGWITPPADPLITASTLTGASSTDLVGGSLTFTASGPAGTISYFTSEPEPCSAGQYAAAETSMVNVFAAGRAGEISLVFYDANGAQISRTGVTSIPSGSASGSVWRTPATVAPANTARVAMRLDAIGATNGPRTMQVQRSSLIVGASAAALAGYAYVAPWAWTNVLLPAHEISVDRAGLTLGTMRVALRDASLDPATNALIRPGKPVRLMVQTNDAGVLTGNYVPLFTGEISQANVSYNLTHPIPAERALITFTATDAAARLANLKQATSVGTMSDLRYLLEGASTPWLINGSTSNLPGSPTVVARNENASILDQIALTRDTRLGHAWVDRYGVLVATDAAPTTVVATYSEPHYRHDLDVDYDTDRCINVVNVKRIGFDLTGAVVETPFGPYVDRASVREWGSRAEDFTVVGLSDAAVANLANAVLSANKTPSITVNRLALPIASLASLAIKTDVYALLDLYDRVTVNNTRAGISKTLRVAGLRHSITPEKWILDVSFASTGGVAMPSSSTPLPGDGVSPVVDNPVGEVRLYAGTAEPSGWKFCRGQAVSKTTYPALFNVLGYTFGGSGDTFYLPNMNARSPIGVGGAASSGSAGNNYSLGQAYGHESMPTHTHGVNDGGHAHNYDELSLDYYAAPSGSSPVIGHTGTARTIRATSAVGANVSIQNAGSGNAGNVHPVIGMNYIIRLLA